MAHDKLFIYRRNYQATSWLVVANFSQQPVRLPEDLNIKGKTIIRNGEISNRQITGYGALVVEQEL